MIKRRINGEPIDKFQIYNKKKLIIDDIEVTVPMNENPWIYFGKRIPAYQYYQENGLKYPIGQYDNILGREITVEDLAKSSYIILLSKNVIKHPEPGAVTVEEIRNLLVKSRNNDKPNI